MATRGRCCVERVTPIVHLDGEEQLVLEWLACRVHIHVRESPCPAETWPVCGFVQPHGYLISSRSQFLI